MKLILYCIILVLIFLAPVNKQDVGDLEPIQAVWLHIENGTVVLQTDTGDYGAGATVESAIAVMKKNSEGVVYLDTAQFLLISENAVELMENMAKNLRKSVKICLWEGNEVKSAARYMQSHDMGYHFDEVQGGKQLQKIPELIEEEDKKAE